MGVIILTLIGCGKTHLIDEYGDKLKILDMTDKPYTGHDMADEISMQSNDYDIVFARADVSLVDALCDGGVDFDLFYPSYDKTVQIVEGLVMKRLDFKAIQELDNNLPKLIKQLDSIDSPHCFKHKLGLDQYLCTDEQLRKYLDSFKDA